MKKRIKNTIFIIIVIIYNYLSSLSIFIHFSSLILLSFTIYFFIIITIHSLITFT